MSYSYQQTVVQVPQLGSLPLGQNVAIPPSKTASPLAQEINKLQTEVTMLETLRDEVFKMLVPVIMKEPPNPGQDEQSEPVTSLSEVPNTVKMQRVRIQVLNDSLRELLRTVQV